MLPSASLLLPPSDPCVAGEVLALLHQLGWDGCLTKLLDRISNAEPGRPRGLLQLYTGWLAAERGGQGCAGELFEAAAALPELEAWAVVGLAFVALGESDFTKAHALLDRAASRTHSEDIILKAAMAHCRGAVLNRQGLYTEALDHLYRALEDFGPDHFGAGRVLDTLGTVYAASQNDFSSAQLFYNRALDLKKRHDDLPGQAVTHGQLGRLYLDWDELDLAEAHFCKDLDLCHRIGDPRGAAIIYSERARVLLRRGKPRPALALLQVSISKSQQGGWTMEEATARTILANALLALELLDEATVEARAAEQLSQRRSQHEAPWAARRVLALIAAKRGNFDEAEQVLANAIAYLDATGKTARAARYWLDLGRVRAARPGQPAILVTEALQAALVCAERSRRDRLLAEIERELELSDEAVYYRRLYQRARGAIREVTTSLREGTGEKATMMFLDLQGFSAYALRVDASLVLLTLNQIFAEVSRVLEQQEIVVNQYLGDGFMALVRGRDHAQRAIAGALDVLRALKAFNRPRRVLGEPLLLARIGVATGDVCFGNVGTHHKVDFTAVGPTTNLAARLQAEADAGEAVCVSEETYRSVEDVVQVKDPVGRLLSLKNMGEKRAWDVLALRRRAT